MVDFVIKTSYYKPLDCYLCLLYYDPIPEDNVGDKSIYLATSTHFPWLKHTFNSIAVYQVIMAWMT